MTLFLAALTLGQASSGPPDIAADRLPLGPGFHVKFEPADAEWGAQFTRYVATSEKLIVAFFGPSFRKGVTLTICPNRSALDEAFKREWGSPKTEPWMIGAAGAERAYFLSPRVWGREAPEHDPKDIPAIERVIVHELVHSYHAQQNPSKDMDGLESLAWFIEGLATHVSGQERAQHSGRAKAALEAGSFPKSLESVWSGRSRYALAGSLVRFLDERFCRRTIWKLLSATTNAQALQTLGASEGELLGAWRSWLRNSDVGRR